ncbi:chromobox protein 3 [Pancytospora philotis]|nr:chromobox protein 3 [Pancytospora philotis]
MSSGSEEDIYEIETIVKDRVVNGRKQYYIKWVGYSDENNTWEDEANILSNELKAEYEASKREAKEKKSPAKRLTKKFSPAVTNEWGDKIEKVLGVSMNAQGTLEVEYVMHDGNVGICSNKDMHCKAPVRLLEFYESNISFPE